MNCLENIYSGNVIVIGIRDYKNCESPISGLYINDIEGLTLKTLAAVTNEEHESGYKFAKDKILLAIKLVIDDFKSQIFPTWTMNQVIESGFTGVFDSKFNNIAPLERGVSLERSTNTKLAKIFINELEILVADTGDNTIKIIDGLNTQLIPVSLVANEKLTLQLNKECESDFVTITMDNYAMRTARMNQTTRMSGGGCRSCFHSRRTGSDNLENTGWNGTGEEYQMYGINAKATLRCSEEELICSVYDKMYFLFWLRSGMEICKEIEMSTRLNPIALFGKEKAAQLYERLSGEYEKKFKIFADSIGRYLGQFSDLCLTCNKSKHVQSRP